MRRKRPYVPKTKGCYECSQRRIHCDRAEPICVKCESRGLRCSGLGPKRIRFADDVAKVERNKRKLVDFGRDDAIGPSGTGPSLTLETLDSQSLFLLDHFSHNVASEMCVIDDRNNGWRTIILPTAHLDSLVQLSVIAAAALHFQNRTSSTILNSAAIYAQALQELRKRQDLAVQSSSQQQGVLLALLVLLAAAMIQGSADFRSIFTLIDKAVEAVGGEDQVASGELGTFIIRQIRKYRGYASPMLTQAMGIHTLSKTTPTAPSTSNGWEDFSSYYQNPLYSSPSPLSSSSSPSSASNISESLRIMYALNALACSMYISRAQRGRGGRGFSSQVEAVRQLLLTLPENCPCEHALVWPTFIAALESEREEHREFFGAELERHWRRNGFGNLRVALGYLRERWEGEVVVDWTRGLPVMGAFVV